MKIIDFAKKGNVVRFYLGKDDLSEWYGDDWDDAPYEHNSGTVYDEFVSGILDVGFPFDWFVIEPEDDWYYKSNSPYCKDDFVRRDAPCIVVVPTEEMTDQERQYIYDDDDYHTWIGSDRAFKIYFGDDTSKISEWKYSKELALSWKT